MFLAAIFTTARSWKQPKCPSTDEWIKKMWYIYTVEYYSAIKRNKTGSFVETWMDLETVIQSEVSQKEKKKKGKKKVELPYDPAISFLGIYLKKTKTLIEKIYVPQCSLQPYLQ